MKLSEGKLFTIEALNRIDGFVWPDGAKFAGMCEEPFCVHFYSAIPAVGKKSDNSALFLDDETVYVGFNSPCWRNSLITRDEFESVDGWVRDSGYPKSMNIEKIQQSSGGYKWRYKKPRNQPEKAADITPAHSIETLISQHKAARLSTLEARKLLERSEAAEHNLLLSIEAWAESNGFDIRLLDEVPEVPKLVITDWRDLQEGDVIWWSGDADNKAGECTVIGIEEEDCKHSISILIYTNDEYGEWINTSKEQWKFIRRPAK